MKRKLLFPLLALTAFASALRAQDTNHSARLAESYADLAKTLGKTLGTDPF